MTYSFKYRLATEQGITLQFICISVLLSYAARFLVAHNLLIITNNLLLWNVLVFAADLTEIDFLAISANIIAS